MKLNIKNETSPLKAVLLGTAQSCGAVPLPVQAYDPKSLEHILAGTYPTDEDMMEQMQQLENVFVKYGVEVFRPNLIEDYNQIFARDIGFVIDDFFFKANMILERSREITAVDFLLNQINPEKVIEIPEGISIEGGDVILYENYIFVGTYKGNDFLNQKTARTNMQGVHFLQKMFPNRIVKELDLIKSMKNAKENVLHLDCCFQPVGNGLAILYENAFRQNADFQFIIDVFGKENIFFITKDEMYEMNSNVLSVSPQIVISDRSFHRLNAWLRLKGISVEEVDYSEVSKQGGLLRCSTLSLIRE